MWVPNLPTAIISAVTATAGGLCIYKDIHSGPPYDKEVRAEDKTVIVTGASSGIGREAALEFANRGAKVFMACRDMSRCEAARRDIVLQTENKFVYCRRCDLASTSSIRDFVQRFKSEEPALHVLVNNAGVMQAARRVTRDGFEEDLGVNHMGHFLLTNLLLDTLKKSEPSRIVIVSSKSHTKGKIHTEDLNLETGKYDARAAYDQSKLANVLFAQELGRKLLTTQVSVAVVDPGLTDTDITRHLPMSKSITRFIIYPLFWPTMKIPRKGAQVIVHAALDPSVKSAKGDYYVDMERKELCAEAQDFEMAQWLWKVSEKWTKLQEHKNAIAESMVASKAT
ncbi:retinol dehydrogenase 13 [Plutella xylostella]|uniref:retinol dehydrogenase 13 n=1 Tax=Plutella xylostella TaxID=51655 RepID=UPI002032C48C|nr:retinol dehydrogenase 13 [Plutella xylostella]